MRRYLFICLLAIITMQSASAQTPEMSDNQSNMMSQAQVMVHAFEQGDYERLLDYTYPAILVMGGGRDMLLSIIAQTMDDLKKQGITIDSARVGIPTQVFPAGDELHGLISQTVYMSTPDSYITSESTLLAVSDDNGSRWYFLDTRRLTPELMTSFFPDFNQNLVIPPAKDVVVTPK